MKFGYFFVYTVLLIVENFVAALPVSADDVKAAGVKEKAFEAPHNVKIRLRMEGPYTADAPLQIVSYFKYTPEGAKRMTGALVELDKRLGGVIAAVRERGEFDGDELETIQFISPKNSIKAKSLLLVGLGDPESLSLKLMEGVGRTSLREAARSGAKRVAFAPLIRDQGNTKFSAGDIELAVIRGMILAYDTDLRLQKEGLAAPYLLEEWIVEAGPAYFDETATAIEKAIQQTDAALKDRKTGLYLKMK
jgi:hypothetical protein